MKKFAVVSQARSGSTLLVNALDAVPEVRCAGEVFHAEPAVRDVYVRHAIGEIASKPDWLLGSGDLPKLVVAERDLHALNANLDAYCFDAMAEQGHKAGGIKVLYSQLRPGWCGAAASLAGCKDLLIVRLIRKDVLACMASWWAARATGNFRDTKTTGKVAISGRGAYAWLKERDACNRLVNDLPNPYAAITYESLVSDFDNTIRLVLRRLGVEHEGLTFEQPTRRQDDRPARDRIENWDELRYYMLATEYADLFKET